MIYYTTSRVSELIGQKLKELGIRDSLSPNTLRVWILKGLVDEIPKDQRGHRVYTPEDIETLIKFAIEHFSLAREKKAKKKEDKKDGTR